MAGKEKELRKMSRMELIEIIYALEQNETILRQEKEQLEQQLKEREIRLAEAGSIAEAAIGLNKVFEAAQAAADQYLDSLKAQYPLPDQVTESEKERSDAKGRA